MFGLCKKNDDRELHNMQDHEISQLKKRVAYLESRIRGIQHQAKEIEKGESMYVIQQPNGRFNKFYLPEVK